MPLIKKLGLPGKIGKGGAKRRSRKEKVAIFLAKAGRLGRIGKAGYKNAVTKKIKSMKKNSLIKK